MEKGKVWLVGAGPSDAGLFTIKGKEVLSQAEVVVYDRLVGHGILSMIPSDAKTIDVGKRAGNHTMPQEDINKVLLFEAQAGKRVVRLKGGDPFLFGRGGEELELLLEHGIPYEVIPGVTSAISVPAYHGIPVTHRDFCSSLHIITGHKKKDEPYDIDFEALVKTKGTLVFLMGVSALPELCQGLLNAGIESEMPAAILQQGTTANQKRIVCTVSTLVEEVERQKIETPAIIVVGKVCSLSDQFAWYEKLPLFGCRIVVTRPKERISVLSGKLKNLGAEVIEFPAIKLVPDHNNEELKQAMAEIIKFQWMVFTSPSGVSVFFQEMRQQKMDIRALSGLKIAAVGSGTRKELEEKGLLVDFVPEVHDGKHLGKLLRKQCQDGDHILIPRAADGNPELVEEIQKNETLTVKDIPIYHTVHGVSSVLEPVAMFEGTTPTLAVFTSASTVRGFAASAGGLDFSKITAACIGQQTKAEADRYGMKTYVAKEASIESLIQLIITMKENN